MYIKVMEGDSAIRDYLLLHQDYTEIEVQEYLGARLRLITPSPKYAQESLTWVSQSDVMQFMGADLSNISLEGEENRLQNIVSDEDAYHWMVEVDGRVVGNTNINNISKMSSQYGGRAGRFNILIGEKDQWGKGVASAVSKAVIDWAFSKGKFDAIITRVMPENVASLNIIKKLGFEQVGIEEELINDKTINYLVLKLKNNKKA